MGTRSLTMVINHEGEKKVAQYGQWHGYPSGVGAYILKFLKDKMLFEKLKANLSKTRFTDPEGVDKEFAENYTKKLSEWHNETDDIVKEHKRLFYTYFTRDLAGKILENIANSSDSEIMLFDLEDTAKDDGLVEYSYVINLQENTFGIYSHIDEEPWKVYNLDELPEEDVFISEVSLIIENN